MKSVTQDPHEVASRRVLVSISGPQRHDIARAVGLRDPSHTNGSQPHTEAVSGWLTALEVLSLSQTLERGGVTFDRVPGHDPAVYLRAGHTFLRAFTT